MEERILEAVLKRNSILNELVKINHLAIVEYKNFDEQDKFHFLMTRSYLIKALEEEENKVIAYSMLDWSSFKYSDSYREDYIQLCKEKENLLCEVLCQDRVLSEMNVGDRGSTVEESA